MEKDKVRLLYKTLSEPIIPWVIKLGLTPSQITILRLIILIPPTMFFLATGNYVCILAALVFYHLFRIFDFIDGEIARIKSLPPPRPLDPIVDAIGCSFVLISIILGIFNSNDGYAVLDLFAFPKQIVLTVGLLALFAQLMCNYLTLELIHTSILHNKDIKAEYEIFEIHPSTPKISQFARDILILPSLPWKIIFSYGYLITFGGLLNQLFVSLLIIAISHNLRWLFMLHIIIRASKGRM